VSQNSTRSAKFGSDGTSGRGRSSRPGLDGCADGGLGITDDTAAQVVGRGLATILGPVRAASRDVTLALWL
jgi:hypothetical protein